MLLMAIRQEFCLVIAVVYYNAFEDASSIYINVPHLFTMVAVKEYGLNLNT